MLKLRLTANASQKLPEGMTQEMVDAASKEATKQFVGANETESKEQTETVLEAPVVKRDTPWPDQSTDNPRVTLAMIVRNEEAHLAECLASMEKHVDEIVIVDTGSTDQTIDIAESFGAKVYKHEWQDSFSVARNQAISYVETPWLIQMDADEVMTEGDAKKIRDTVRSAHKSTTNLIHMVLVNKKKGDDQNISIINSGKIMRVTPALHFTHRVHNKLHCPGDTRLTNLRITHYGYSLPDQETMQNKKERTTRLLHMQAEDMPDDPDTFYYLAIQYLRYQEYDKVIEYGKKGVELYKKFDPKSQLQLLCRHSIAVAYYHKASDTSKTQDEQKVFFGECEGWCKQALEIYPDYLDSNALLSSLFFALKDYAQCWKHSEKYLQIVDMLKKDDSKALVIPINTIKNEWMICLQLAINFYEQADSGNAVKFLAKAEDLLPTDQKYRPSWGVFKYMITMGDPASLSNAEAIYKTGFRPE